MSSGEENEPGGSRPRRKSRRTRACDMCRRRKVRCDGSRTGDGPCTNCITFKYKCTYVQSAPKRPLDPGYVEALEEQVAEMRSLLDKYRKLYPGSESSGRIHSDIPVGTTFTATSSSSPPSSIGPGPSGSPSSNPFIPASVSAQQTLPIGSLGSPALTDDEPQFEPSDDEVEFRKTMVKPFQRATLFPGEDSFQGKSSSMMFIRAALHTKREYFEGGQAEYLRGLKDGGKEVADGFSQIAINADKEREKGKGTDTDIFVWRPLSNEAWSAHPWVMRTIEKPPTLFEFPPSDLLEKLVTTYFTEVNSLSPVFHQPTFERALKEGLQYHNEDFGSVVLLLCAVAARSMADDPRVLLAEERFKNERVRKGKSTGQTAQHMTYHSAGWQWFEQVQRTRPGVSFRPPSLYDMQVAYLVAQYTVEASLSWNGVGYGLRIGQMLGVHRRKSYDTVPTVEGELRKRVFWGLVLHDRTHSSVFGRACSIHDEDFDLDLPIVCDDEYWSNPDPEKAFKQPDDKPSKVAFFNCMLRLSQIHAYALRTIYSINKSKALLGLVGFDVQQRVVAQIDSALNRWLDSIPQHLRWDPKIPDDLFFRQSVALHAAYYNVCIVVHRPFIPSPRHPPRQSSPSLTICVNAARSCINLVDEEYKRTGMAREQHSIFMSAIVLLLNIWSQKKSIASPEAVKEMQLVRRVLEIEKDMEKWSNGSAKIWDALSNLVRMSEMNMPEQPVGSKRPRDGSSEQQDSTDIDAPPINEREMAGSKRVHLFEQQQHEQNIGISPSTVGVDEGLSTMPPHPPSENHYLGTASSWNLDPGYGNMQDLQAMSFFASDPDLRVGPEGSDVTMNPAIDPVVEALLSMLSPAQYQQTQVASASNMDSHATQNPTHLADESVWADPTFGAGFQQDVVDEVAGKMSSNPFGMQFDGAMGSAGEMLGYDPSTTWSSAPNGFAWEDWEPYLANYRQEEEGVHRRNVDQQ